jgi:tRNA (guanine9-N1)-methyltransferase
MSKGKWKIHLSSSDVMSIPEAQSHEIVMLSPDATDSLDSINPNSMYVIGGLVDRTRKKAESLKKAMERRVKCVKLPIREEISIVFYI